MRQSERCRRERNRDRIRLAQRRYLIIRRDDDVIRRDRAQLSREARTAQRLEFIHVDFERHAVSSRGGQNPAGLIEIERADFTKHIAKQRIRPAFVTPAGDSRQHLIQDHIDLSVRVVRVFRRDGVRAEKRRHQIDRVLLVQARDSFEHHDLSFSVQTVAGFALDRCRAMR